LEFSEYDLAQTNRVSVNIKEIFEKWDKFNLLFWTVVDWSGTVLKVDNAEYHSHDDKTKIFYSLQESHKKWLNYLRFKYSNLDKIYTGKTTLTEIEGEYLTDAQINDLIDSYNLGKDADTGQPSDS